MQCYTKLYTLAERMNAMEKEFEYVESTSSGQILRKKTQSTRIPYEHQIKAMQCLDKINESPSFATIKTAGSAGGLFAARSG